MTKRTKLLIWIGVAVLGLLSIGLLYRCLLHDEVIKMLNDHVAADKELSGYIESNASVLGGTNMEEIIKNTSLMTFVFYIVAGVLYGIGQATGLSYNEVNILAYYFLVPFIWLALLDVIIKKHYFKVVFAVCCVGFWIWCKDFKGYSDWLFDKSVDFLNYFDRFGLNYIEASIWICVVIPLMVYMLLVSVIIYRKYKSKEVPISSSQG